VNAYRAAPVALTPREREVYQLRVRGYGNADVARVLGVGLKAVEKHVTEIYNKLGIPPGRRSGIVRFEAEGR
jgi:DNA-binding NarL/FixJ family response regulator